LFQNDYISTFIERIVAKSAGVEKVSEFLTVLRLIAARFGELLSYESLGRDAGVTGKTIKVWISLLEKNKVLFVLQPFYSNLNKRFIKASKLYFLDPGICTRLQAHQELESILNTPQVGHLFENLVVSEVVKTKDHIQKDWNLFFWRTKEGEEVDLIIEIPKKIVLIELKLGSHNGRILQTPKTLVRVLKRGQSFQKILVVATGPRFKIASDCDVVPYQKLCEYLLENL
jgi:predicted AAA+ superfamily ATPase